jgi:LmbE family N-acetylglucosaminyl deacetylase
MVVSGISASLGAQTSTPPRPADVFIVAHQDDWQLFMGDVAFRAVRRGNQAVFIYLTAGDESHGSDYWKTRELAALQSTRLAAGVPSEARGTECTNVVVRSHGVRRCVLASTVSFFLRLPDGARGGSGFDKNSFQSLRKLRAKRISALTSLDTSATYNGWGDLVATVEALIRSAATTASSVTLHANDPNAAINPRDHSDHRMAGFIAVALRKTTGWRAIYYIGYALAARPDNRSRAQVRQKTALFLVYDREMLIANRGWSAYAERPRFYSMCMLRTYARQIPRR